MPEYLSPGVYIEETSYRAKTIEGVSTTVTGFVGPTRFGPTKGALELLTSFAAFERIYGGIDPLQFGTTLEDNFMAHAVRAFFENGGTKLYVSRVYKPKEGSTEGKSKEKFTGYAKWLKNTSQENNVSVGGGAENAANSEDSSNDKEQTEGSWTFRARYPGAAGNMLITFNFRLGQNILTAQNALSGATNYDLVLVTPKPTNDSDAPSDSEDTVETETPPETHTPDAPAEPDENSEAETPSAPGAPSSTNDSSEPDNESDQAGDNSTGGLYWLEPYFDETTNTNQLRLRDGKEESNNGVYSLDKAKEVKIVTIDVTARMPGPNGLETTWETLSFHPDHRRALGRMFGETPRNRATALYVPLVFNAANQTNGPAIAEALITKLSVTQKKDVVPTDPLRALLKGGNDGTRPTGAEYEGDDNDNSGLKAFENIADISIVAAPGSTVDLNSGQAQLITSHLISHCERMRYRIAVLDSVKGKLVSDVQKWRGQIDSKHAALYYPWVTTLDPITGEEINLPPSGFVAGIYARNDVEKGVHKAPANEVVRLAIGFEKLLNKAQQDVLNPEGINCFRFFDGRGYRLWGARTISSDPEWKYVNLRRYFAYLERSIELGTQWVVFENNDHRLWAKVRRTVEDFLYNEWKSGHLFGEKPEEAYFVRCDLSTMTQNDLDNGRLVCLIGVAPVRPAEFVIFRIGQWTAERRS